MRETQWAAPSCTVSHLSNLQFPQKLQHQSFIVPNLQQSRETKEMQQDKSIMRKNFFFTFLSKPLTFIKCPSNRGFNALGPMEPNHLSTGPMEPTHLSTGPMEPTHLSTGPMDQLNYRQGLWTNSHLSTGPMDQLNYQQGLCNQLTYHWANGTSSPINRAYGTNSHISTAYGTSWPINRAYVTSKSINRAYGVSK